MENNLTKETSLKIKSLGIYQISGGIVGLGLTGWIISELATISGLLLLLLLAPVILYAYSIYCGVLLLKKNTSGLSYSLINQFLQLLNISILGFTFQYVSGAFLSVGLDLTNSFIFTFNLGISAWQIIINGDSAPLIVNFNFVALFLIFFIERLKKKIDKERLENEITSIGQ